MEIDEPFHSQKEKNINNNTNMFNLNEWLLLIRSALELITICVGLCLYILAIKDLYNSFFGELNLYIYSIYASLLTVFCPLWCRTFDKIKKNLDDCLKKYAFVVY